MGIDERRPGPRRRRWLGKQSRTTRRGAGQAGLTGARRAAAGSSGWGQSPRREVDAAGPKPPGAGSPRPRARPRGQPSPGSHLLHCHGAWRDGQGKARLGAAPCVTVWLRGRTAVTASGTETLGHSRLLYSRTGSGMSSQALKRTCSIALCLFCPFNLKPRCPEKPHSSAKQEFTAADGWQALRSVTAAELRRRRADFESPGAFPRGLSGEAEKPGMFLKTNSRL